MELLVAQVSVRFWASEQCSFLREETREVEDPRPGMENRFP